MDTQPTPTGTTEDDDAFRAAVRKGVASAAQGRLVPYAKVKAWLENWGSDHELPVPHRT
jgi:predicted transcriptional regulator